MDTDGCLIVVDWCKEMFGVISSEIEAKLLKIHQALDVAIVPIPAGDEAQVPCAAVVPRSKAVLSDPAAQRMLTKTLTNAIARTLAPYKHLAGGVAFFAAIPCNSTFYHAPSLKQSNHAAKMLSHALPSAQANTIPFDDFVMRSSIPFEPLTGLPGLAETVGRLLYGRIRKHDPTAVFMAHAMGPDRRRLTYGKLLHDALGLAHGLINKMGLRRGDRVAIVAPNHERFHMVEYACMFAGIAGTHAAAAVSGGTTRGTPAFGALDVTTVMRSDGITCFFHLSGTFTGMSSAIRGGIVYFFGGD
ncbi:hypothetical protein GGF31_007824 [Allomyces arbusculus]|nr:hypothetical protein GGF31_007824 [Allomyces arbusculus]